MAAALVTPLVTSALTVAANAGRGTRQAPGSIAQASTNFGVLQSPFPNSFNGTRDYEFAGIDIDWRKGAFIFKGEAYVSSEKGFADQRALSAETTYFVHPKWGLSYRYDFYDAGGDLTNAALSAAAMVPQTRIDLGHSTEHVVGVSYNPASVGSPSS